LEAVAAALVALVAAVAVLVDTKRSLAELLKRDLILSSLALVELTELEALSQAMVATRRS
jgi:hypothetical protein